MEMMSKTGTYHMQTHTENQDAVQSCAKGRLAGLFLADGMSACAQAGSGARRSCQAMKHLMMSKGDCLMDVFTETEIAELTLSHVQHELCLLAQREGNPVEDYASTLACAVLDRKTGRLLTLNLGDGLIAGVRRGELQILAMPDDTTDGCCGTITRNAAARTAVQVVDAAELDAVFVCSDGAWRELFDGTRLRAETARLLREGTCADLAEYLRQTEAFDDCSFVSMDLTKE